MTPQSTTRDDKKASDAEPVQFGEIRQMVSEGDVVRVNGDPRELRVTDISERVTSCIRLMTKLGEKAQVRPKSADSTLTTSDTAMFSFLHTANGAETQSVTIQDFEVVEVDG
jgi:hypothetical protein